MNSIAVQIRPEHEFHEYPARRMDKEPPLMQVRQIHRLIADGKAVAPGPRSLVVIHSETGMVEHFWQGSSQPIHAVTETKLVPSKTQRFIEFFKDRPRDV